MSVGLNITADKVLKGASDGVKDAKKNTDIPDDTKSVIGDEYILVKKSRTVSDSSLKMPSLLKMAGSGATSGDVKFNHNGKDGVDWNSLPSKVLSLPDIKLVQELKESLRASNKETGRKPVDIIVCATSSLPNTAAGVNANQIILDPSIGVDFTSLAAIYDEVRCTKVDLKYSPFSWKNGAIATGIGTGNLPFGVMAVDCGDIGALSSWVLGTQNVSHAVYPIGCIATDTAPTCFALAKSCKLRFQPPPLGLAPGGGVFNTPFVGSAWCSTSGSYPTVCPVGTLKFYEVNSLNNSIYVGGLELKFHCQFRMRS